MLKHTHISLVGGQTTPVYQGVVFVQPDEIILICSEQTKEETERIKREISMPCKVEVFDPVDYNKALSKVKMLCEKLTDCKVTVNISSGTKPWSIAFFSVFRERANADILYIDQNNKVWDLKTGTSHTVQFDMDTQFRLYGNQPRTFERLDDYTEDDKQSILKIKQLRKNYPSDFNSLVNTLSERNDLTNHQLPSGSTLLWDKTTKSFSFSFQNKNRSEKVVLQSPNIRKLLLNTGWFEYEVALMLDQWEKAKEIRLNCVFPAKNNADKNEADIIVNTGNKLLFVECKTQIHTITDIDKFRSVVKNYGGMGSKALFVTDAPMSSQALEKCADNGILTFSLQNNMLGQTSEKILSLLLNNELDKINPR